MDQYSTHKKDENEIHSEKVRKLLENIPVSVSILSIATIAILTILLLTALCIIPYPHSEGDSILWHFLR